MGKKEELFKQLAGSKLSDQKRKVLEKELEECIKAEQTRANKPVTAIPALPPGEYPSGFEEVSFDESESEYEEVTPDQSKPEPSESDQLEPDQSEDMEYEEANSPRYEADTSHVIALNGGRKPLYFEYPSIENGRVERVLAFNNDEQIMLKNLPKIQAGMDLDLLFQKLHDAGEGKWPYFSSRGPLTDLNGNVMRGTWVETTFPIDPLSLIYQESFPTEGDRFPYDRPPVFLKDDKRIFPREHGYSKQAYFFNDKDSFVTIGPSLPKIARVTEGRAQFWVGSIGVIAQGTGAFKDAKGVSTYVGSGFLPRWPEDFPSQAPILARGFKAWIGTFVKVVLRGDLAH